MRVRDRVLAHAAAILAAAGSVALSLIAIARGPIVNNDGARYLAAAEAFAASGLDGAQRIYPWPFYSVLIASLMPVAGSAVAAAHLADTILLAIASAAFVLIVRELGADRPTQFVAAALVLTHPGLTHMRAAVVRDFGLWACALLGVLALIRYARGGGVPAAVAWTGLGAAAVFFRPDAAAIWATSALALLVIPGLSVGERTKRLALLAALPLSALLVAVAAFSAVSHVPWGVLQQAMLVLRPSTAAFTGGAQALAAGFPYPHGREYAPYILLWGLTAIPPVKIVRALGLAQALLATAGATMARRDSERAPRRIVALATVGAILPLFALLPARLFVETRYAILSSLFLLAFAPFGLVRLMRTPSAGARTMGWVLAGVVAGGWLLDLRLAPDDASSIQAASQWLEANAPPNAHIHTNCPPLAYYSRRHVEWNEVEALLLGGSPKLDAGAPDYVALLLAAQDGRPPAVADPMLQLRASFGAPDGHHVVIYADQR